MQKKKAIEMKTGILIIPEEYIEIEEMKTAESDYAGIVTERYNTIPHYIAFFDKPFANYTAEEQDEILIKCGEIYPEIADVLKKEVKMVFDDNNHVQNADEWDRSVRVAINPVPEYVADEAFDHETAIVRRA